VLLRTSCDSRNLRRCGVMALGSPLNPRTGSRRPATPSVVTESSAMEAVPRTGDDGDVL
jgi:hypothetical protein